MFAQRFLSYSGSVLLLCKWFYWAKVCLSVCVCHRPIKVSSLFYIEVTGNGAQPWALSTSLSRCPLDYCGFADISNIILIRPVIVWQYPHNTKTHLSDTPREHIASIYIKCIPLMQVNFHVCVVGFGQKSWPGIRINKKEFFGVILNVHIEKQIYIYRNKYYTTDYTVGWRPSFEISHFSADVDFMLNKSQTFSITTRMLFASNISSIFDVSHDNISWRCWWWGLGVLWCGIGF